MTTAEVGSGQVAIFPTFKGFRSKVGTEMSGAGRDGGKTFNSAFNRGAGDPGEALIKKLNARIAAGSRALSSARLAEQDAAGRVRVAETALAEARAKGGEASSRAVAAEERLATAQRKLTEAQARTKTSSDQLKDSQAKLADQMAAAGGAGEQASTRYARGWTGLKQRLTSVMRGAVDDAGEASKRSAQSSGKVSGGAFATAFKGAMGALAGAFAVDKLVSGIRDAVNEAGNLQQSGGAIQTVFKGSAQDMLKWSDQAKTSVGLTKNEYNELGTLIGSQLKNGGTAMDQMAPKTNQLITLGADLSSMFGGTSREAIEALSSALKGERDPIERYGVSLTQAKIDAEALAMGAQKVDGAFSNQAQQAATLSLIMKQTADAQGNFAKESDTLQGQQQRAISGWKNITAGIGGLFLPVLTKTFGFVNSSVLPVIDTFVTKLGDGGLKAVFPELVGGITAFGAAWKANDGDITSSGFPGFMEAAANAIRPVFDALLPSISAIAPMVMELLPVFLQLFQALSPTSLIFQALLPVLPQIAATVGDLLTTFLGLATSLASQLLPIVTQLVTAILPPLTTIFTDIFNAIAPLITQLADLLIPIIQALMPVVVTVFGVVASVIAAAMQIVQGIIQIVTGLISGNWDQVWQGIQNVFAGIWNTIVAVVQGAIGIVWSLITNGLGLVWGIVTSILGSIGQFFIDTWNNVTAGVSGFVAGFLQFFADLPGKVLETLGNLGTLLLDAGKALIQGFIDGIKGMVGGIGDAVGGVLDFAKGFFPHSPAKRGPFSGSGYTTHSGKALARDFASSIEAQKSRVAEAASSIMTAAQVNGTVQAAAGQPAGGSRAPAVAGSWREGAKVDVHMAVRERVSPAELARAFDNQLNYALRSSGG